MESNSSNMSSKSSSSKASSKSKKQSNEDEKMIEIITLFSRHLEQETLSEKIIDVFFNIIESRNKLPINCDKKIIEAFLSSIISVISLKEDPDMAFRCLKILTSYLKNDAQLFSKFKPNSLIVK